MQFYSERWDFWGGGYSLNTHFDLLSGPKTEILCQVLSAGDLFIFNRGDGPGSVHSQTLLVPLVSEP